MNEGTPLSVSEQDLVYRLRKRAEIRRQIPSRKSVQEGKPDRVADLLEEAANEIEQYRNTARMALEASELALRYKGVMLLSDPPQDAWKYHRVEHTLQEAIASLRQTLGKK